MSEDKKIIFISYAHEDIGMAKRIYNELIMYNLYIWFDQITLLPGQDWQNEIENAIENCDYFLALISNNSITKKGFIQKESKKALDVIELFPEDEIFIIPVRLEKCFVKNRKLRRLQWIDIFPEREFLNGIRKILKVISPMSFKFRSNPLALSQLDANNTIRIHGFFDNYINPNGKGLAHDYQMLEKNNEQLIIDKATGLIWQKSGSISEMMKFQDAEQWIFELNNKKYGGFDDWRIPTLEEAASLFEPNKKNVNLFIDKNFDPTQQRIWTSDKTKDKKRYWVANFSYGSIYFEFYVYISAYVRAVRSIKPSYKL